MLTGFREITANRNNHWSPALERSRWRCSSMRKVLKCSMYGAAHDGEVINAYECHGPSTNRGSLMSCTHGNDS